jgi:hypothetical protein
VEKEIVRAFLYPTFLKEPASITLSDQFAFRPTGSTTAALITLLHQITELLRDNDYVSIISMDYSKAFDTVRHSTLMDKIAQLNIPDNIYNWIAEYFYERKHVTRFDGVVTPSCSISASVVQGSALGPAAFIITASDLHPVNGQNKLVKYADDMYLLVGSGSYDTVQEELVHVASWAADNNLGLNPNKLSEMVVTRRGTKASQRPITSGIQRVDSLKILGVYLQPDLNMATHISEVLGSCASSLYALRVLRNHGLPPAALHEVARASTLARLMYAAPAWWGYTNAGERDRLEGFIRKTKRYGYLPPSAPTAEEMCGRADDNLFRAVKTDRNHVLHALLPPPRSHEHSLRPRSHNFMLPDKDNKNFLTRMLYKNIY